MAFFVVPSADFLPSAHRFSISYVLVEKSVESFDTSSSVQSKRGQSIV